jgi:hypothetical protein
MLLPFVAAFYSFAFAVRRRGMALPLCRSAFFRGGDREKAPPRLHTSDLPVGVCGSAYLPAACMSGFSGLRTIPASGLPDRVFESTLKNLSYTGASNAQRTAVPNVIAERWCISQKCRSTRILQLNVLGLALGEWQ